MTRTITVSLSEQGGFAKYHFDNLYVLDNYVRGMVPGQPFERSAVDAGRMQLLAVFDGLGEGELGVEASRIAAEILDRHRMRLEHDPETPFKDFVRAFVDEANAALCDGIRRHRGLRMGTSFALLCIRDGIARTANIGNSHVFLYRGESLIQMTYDHTQAQRLVRLGVISPDEARTHPERDVLTQYLGIFPEEMELEPSYGPTVILQKGDTFVLASNSVTEVLENEAIRAQIAMADVFSTLPHRIVQQAQQMGSRDNLSLIAVRVLETDPQQAQIAAGTMVDVTTQIPAGEIQRALESAPMESQHHPRRVPDGRGDAVGQREDTMARHGSPGRAALTLLSIFVLFAFVGVAMAKLMFSWDSWFGGRPTRVTTSLATTVDVPTSPVATTQDTTPPATQPPTASMPPAPTTLPAITPVTVPTTEATTETTTTETTTQVTTEASTAPSSTVPTTATADPTPTTPAATTPPTATATSETEPSEPQA